MKKTIFVMLVALLLVSSIASAGVWEKLTGHALFGSSKKANGEVCKTASTCIENSGNYTTFLPEFSDG